MNEQNNNNITLMTDIDPSLYTNLKPKQQAFIHCIAESIGSMTTTEFSRKDLRTSPTIMVSHGRLHGS